LGGRPPIDTELRLRVGFHMRWVRETWRNKDTRATGAAAAVYLASAARAKRGSPSLALYAALVHTS
jgi:hypothetical protein